MSERKHPDKPRDDDDAFEDAVVAADDTGMVRNEIEIEEAETEEGLGH